MTPPFSETVNLVRAGVLLLTESGNHGPLLCTVREPLLHRPLHRNALTALRADERFDGREARERVQRVAMGTASGAISRETISNMTAGARSIGTVRSTGTRRPW